MNRLAHTLTAALAALGLVTLTAAPALAATPAPYVFVLWEAGPGDVVWPDGGQTLVDAREQDTYELVEWIPRDQLTPCTTYQVDGYLNDDTTRALLAGGKLYGPHNPAESFPKDQPSKYIVFQTECPPPVPPQPDDLTGTDTTVTGPVCAEPLDGRTATTTTDTPWTQTHVLTGGTWQPAEKTYGEPVVTVEYSDDTACIPAPPEVPAPNSETTATEWSTEQPTCDAPTVTQTRQVTTTATTYSTVWNATTRAWEPAAASSTTTTLETRPVAYTGPTCLLAATITRTTPTTPAVTLAETGGTSTPLIPIAAAAILLTTGIALRTRTNR